MVQLVLHKHSMCMSPWRGGLARFQHRSVTVYTAWMWPAEQNQAIELTPGIIIATFDLATERTSKRSVVQSLRHSLKRMWHTRNYFRVNPINALFLQMCQSFPSTRIMTFIIMWHKIILVLVKIICGSSLMPDPAFSQGKGSGGFLCCIDSAVLNLNECWLRACMK